MNQRVAKKTMKPHEVPAYGLGEAARYLKIAPATLRSWTLGRTYPLDRGKGFFEPLITLAGPDGHLLSFANLVEAHVLRALRTEHGISVKDVRTAIRYAEKELGVDHLLLSPKLRTAERGLFLRKYGTLINLSRAGQLAMERLLDAHLRRVEWKVDVPLKLYPFIPEEIAGANVISINPSVQFGRPVLESRAIKTESIVERIDAGETVDDLAKDYGVRPEEITAAIVYERAA
ncbi:MAG TPA: DUF433 domain-containing protein [Candidatus Krumholzibacteria bacterium]|nr:DUF433 domain-containing protein [Candidatus Krumholzibacteria bacterium]